MSRGNARWAVLLALIVVIVFAVAGGAIAKKGGVPGGLPDGTGGPPDGKGPGAHTAANSQSFPVIAVDGFSILLLTESLTLQYAGASPGLADSTEYGQTYIDIHLIPNPPWYAQKTEDKWQASYATRAKGKVTVVDCSDSMKVAYPKAGTPFRL